MITIPITTIVIAEDTLKIKPKQKIHVHSRGVTHTHYDTHLRITPGYGASDSSTAFSHYLAFLRDVYGTCGVLGGLQKTPVGLALYSAMWA